LQEGWPPFKKSQRRVWIALQAPEGELWGLHPRRCSSCQGLRPLAASCALRL